MKILKTTAMVATCAALAGCMTPTPPEDDPAPTNDPDPMPSTEPTPAPEGEIGSNGLPFAPVQELSALPAGTILTLSMRRSASRLLNL